MKFFARAIRQSNEIKDLSNIGTTIDQNKDTTQNLLGDIAKAIGQVTMAVKDLYNLTEYFSNNSDTVFSIDDETQITGKEILDIIENCNKNAELPNWTKIFEIRGFIQGNEQRANFSSIGTFVRFLNRETQSYALTSWNQFYNGYLKQYFNDNAQALQLFEKFNTYMSLCCSDDSLIMIKQAMNYFSANL